MTPTAAELLAMAAKLDEVESWGGLSDEAAAMLRACASIERDFDTTIEEEIKAVEWATQMCVESNLCGPFLALGNAIIRLCALASKPEEGG